MARSDGRLLPAQDRFKPILIRTRTRVVERTNLETDGENWRGRCSCGWKTPIFRRRKTAERHVNLHYEARANMGNESSAAKPR